MPPIKGNMFKYTEDQMKASLDAVSRGESVASAARNNCVPRSTLISRLQGKVSRFRQMGPESILTKDEEKNIVLWVFTMAKAGFPIGKEALLSSVQHLIRELHRKNPFKEDRPGRKWYYSFLKRNPEVSARTAQNLTISRASVTKESLNHWFQEIKTYLADHKLEEVLNHPKRIFNGDESAFFLNPKGSKVLAKKGDKTIYQQVNSDDKECLTVLVTGNAAGDMAPPMVLFRYSRIPKEITDSVPGFWGIGKSESGWMTGETFYEYITNVFYPWLLEAHITLPIILFIDGHASHLTLHLSKFCESKGIILVALYPNATHLIQPMDVAVFRTLKDGWKTKVQQWRISNYDAPVLKKVHFSPLLAELLKERVTPSVLQNGFRKSGIFPWDPNAVKLNNTNTEKLVNNVPETEALESKISALEAGLKFLEDNCDYEKILAFKGCDVWKGDVHDHSLFNLFKEKSTELQNLKSQKQTNLNQKAHVVEEEPNEVTSEKNHIPLNGTKENTSIGETPIAEVFKQPSTPRSTPILKTPTKINENEITPDQFIVQPNEPTTSSYLVPSPFKRALFWPEPKEKKPSKRSKKEKVPSVITSKKWQEYHEKKLMEKLKEEENKKRRREERKRNKEEKENIKREKQEERELKKIERLKAKTIKVYSSSSDSESHEEWQESGDSLDDVSFSWNANNINQDDNFEKEIINNGNFTVDEVQEDSMSSKESEENNRGKNLIEYKEGDYILVAFPGKKREHKFVCVIQEVCSNDELEVVAMKACNEAKTLFKLNEDDVSVIKLTQVVEKLDFPKMTCAGDRLKYEFNKKFYVDG